MARSRFIAQSIWTALLLVHGTSLALAAEETHGAASHAAPHAAGAEHGDHGMAVDAAHHGSGGLPQLDPSTFETQLIWLFIVFTFLYMFFSKKSLPEIRTVIENRHERIQNDLDTAGRLKSDAETVRKTYEEGIQKAQTKATEIFADVEEAIRQKAEKDLKAFSGKSADKLEISESEIKKAKEQAFKEIESVTAELGKKAAEKILGAKLDAAKAA
ncbi:MAG: F0F1 ATP synthase subunit B' [Alphaproteobacteria bacterium]|nr:F0F1 ATP synthase subunit B' [Alphaproteobacteria bacterium]